MARKHKSAGYVKPELVLINSNVKIIHNLSENDAEPFNSRLFVIPDLKSSTVLKYIYGHLHPKFFTVLKPPTDEMIAAYL